MAVVSAASNCTSHTPRLNWIRPTQRALSKRWATLNCVVVVWARASTSAVHRAVRTGIRAVVRRVVIVHRAAVALERNVIVATVRHVVETANAVIAIVVANAARDQRARLARRVIAENAAIAVIVQRVRALVGIVRSVANVRHGQVLVGIVRNVANVRHGQASEEIVPSVVIVRRVLVASVRSVQALVIAQRVRVLVTAASVQRVPASARIGVSVVRVLNAAVRRVVAAVGDVVRSAAANHARLMNVVPLAIGQLPSVLKPNVSGRHAATA